MNTKPSVGPPDCLMSCCLIDYFVPSLKYVVLGTVADYSLHDMSSSAPEVKHQFLFRFSVKSKNQKVQKENKHSHLGFQSLDPMVLVAYIVYGL